MELNVAAGLRGVGGARGLARSLTLAGGAEARPWRASCSAGREGGNFVSAPFVGGFCCFGGSRSGIGEGRSEEWGRGGIGILVFWRWFKSPHALRT